MIKRYTCIFDLLLCKCSMKDFRVWRKAKNAFTTKRVNIERSQHIYSCEFFKYEYQYFWTKNFHTYSWDIRNNIVLYYAYKCIFIEHDRCVKIKSHTSHQFGNVTVYYKNKIIITILFAQYFRFNSHLFLI